MRASWKTRFAVFLLLAITGYEAMSAADPAFTQFYQTGGSEDISDPIFPAEGDVSGCTPSSEAPAGESEDEDETSKEAFYHPTSTNLSLLVRQRHLLQQSIFQRLCLEIETPPPRF